TASIVQKTPIDIGVFLYDLGRSLRDGSSLEVRDEVFQSGFKAIGVVLVTSSDREGAERAFFKAVGDSLTAGVTMDNHNLERKWPVLGILVARGAEWKNTKNDRELFF